MRPTITLTIVSLLAILLESFHLTQDVMHGVDDPQGIKVGALILLGVLGGFAATLAATCWWQDVRAAKLSRQE